MRILLAGPARPWMTDYLSSFGDEVNTTEEPLDHASALVRSSDHIVSYGFRHIIRAPVLEAMRMKVINLHISLLPWNRGSDPNQWSFLEDTPKGVSIHFVDEGLDTGDIIRQREVPYEMDDTLKTSYERLSVNMKELFMTVWPDIRLDRVEAVPQPAEGTYHRQKDLVPFQHLFTDGYDTPVKPLIGAALREGVGK